MVGAGQGALCLSAPLRWCGEAQVHGKQDVQGGFVLLKAVCSHGPHLVVAVCRLLALAVPLKWLVPSQ